MELFHRVMDADAEGLLLRTYLLGHLHLSHRLLCRLKQTPGGILLNGLPVTVRAVLHKGDTLTLTVEEKTAAGGDTGAESGAPPLPPLLWLDGDILVVNKPGNMPTHPSHGHRGDTLSDALCSPQNGNTLLPDGVFRPVNRLDAETSGIVLVARNQFSAAFLGEAMKAGRIRKQYFALLDGQLPAQRGTLDQCIRRAEESVITRTVCRADEPGAQTAITRYRVIAADSRYTLVCAQPLTGRTHQLRVHFSACGAPIVGDWLYGTPAQAIPRQALHACTLTFPHPRTGSTLTLCAPLPPDFRALLSSISL